MKLYFSNINTDNFYSLSNNFENIAYNYGNLSQTQKENLFTVIFYAKYTFYYLTETKDFNSCMDDQLDCIFGNDNYVDDIAFIVGCPGSAIWVAVYCAFD